MRLKERETRKTPALRNNIYEKLSEAQAFAEAKQYAEAEAVLDMLDATKEQAESLQTSQRCNTYAYFAMWLKITAVR